MFRQPFTLLIHIALAIILAGAIVTHYCGIQGELSLSEDAGTVATFVKTSGPGDGKLPFKVRLESADIDFYPGTTTPMDFRSVLAIDGKPVTVSMNKVAQVDGWRFYQSGISSDATNLSVSFDPWGTCITYIGYALLFVGMAGYFLQRKTPWRSLLRSATKAAVPVVLLLASFSAEAAAAKSALPVMQRPLAANMGKVYVYWNDRICPLQTMAYDVTRKLYGAKSYQGLTPEQVLSGWLFYFDTWKRDYGQNHDEEAIGAKQQKIRNEKLALIQWLGSGEAFKIYPYRTAAGHMEWLSLTGRRPSQMDLEQWKFMLTTMPEIKSLLLQGQNVDANKVIDSLKAGQIRYAGVENLPSEAMMQAERIYNRYANLLAPAIVLLVVGLFYLYVAIRGSRVAPRMMNAMNIGIVVVACYFVTLMATLWWISGHVPLSNGPEMMMFMGLFALICSLAVKVRMLKGAFVIVAAMTLFVGLMGGSTPRIGMLMPVLASPLLSVHVMLVMTSYVFFMIMAILSAIALATKDDKTADVLSRYNRIILVPAVFLLAAGIFVGAIWANQSWGRYWGWDPKETCALVVLLVYSVPVHWGVRQVKAFRRPKVLHWYLLCAVLTVAFTYFGANYLLPGLHSYA